MAKNLIQTAFNPCPAWTEKDLKDMSRIELMKCAAEVGAKEGESLEESAIRFEQEGNEEKAEMLHYMAFRWWALEE